MGCRILFPGVRYGNKKENQNFFKSLRFRILVILVILGIVPGIIATQLMIGNYKQQAIEVRTGEIRTQCAILCNQIIKENYLNDPSQSRSTANSRFWPTLTVQDHAGGP